MSKDKHTAQIGGHVGRVGVYLYAREYIRYHSWQFGVSVDAVNGYDRYVDVELKILCFGVGIRFIWIKRKNKR
ncbi:hypothetical protein AS73P1_00037 [Alistipes phage AS73P1]|nr:hypothetical protein AS73P1_00037 [Alistipes phage AS73P1]